MNICTFNVNSIRARKDLVLSWLDHRNNDLDVLLFQELKGVEDLFPFQAFKDRGFTAHVSGQKAYNGVAVCSRIPVRKTTAGFGISPWDEQKRIIETLLGDLHLMNIYAPHGGQPGSEKFAYKMGWYETLISYLSQHFDPETPLIIAGDFNVAHTDRDVYSPEYLEGAIGTLPEERVLFQRLLDWGFTDVFRHLSPEETQFTWWDYMTAAIWRDEGMRIDYVLCTKPLLPKVKSIKVDLWPRKRRTPTPSDHAPLIVTLDI